MKAGARPIFTASRIIGLVLAAVAVGGLAYLALRPGTKPVSVPAGAKAGELSLHPCRFATEDGSYAADCGTLVVPESRHNPQSRLIALPVTRIRAHSDHPSEPVFKLQGGPGGTNMTFKEASWITGEHDVVVVGYRGVDGSSRLDCPEVTSALQHSRDVLSEASFRAYGEGFRSCAARLTAAGVDVTAYSLVDQIDDMEAARIALGYGRIDLVSESAGTRTAIVYAWRYPNSIFRSAMIGVNPPGHFFWDGKTTDEQIARYAAYCARDEGCANRTNDLAASLRKTVATMPHHWLFLPIKPATVKVATFMGLFETSKKMAPLNGPMTIDGWLSAADGDPSSFWLATVAGNVIFPKVFVWGQYAAFGLADVAAVDAYYAAGGDHDSILGDPLTAFSWGGGRLGGVWPVSPDVAEYSRVRTSAVETLLVSGELDFSTPPQVATKELLPYLPNGHQVVLAGFGHTASFWNDQREAGSRLLNTFFATGKVDESLYKPARLDFSPTIGQPEMAKAAAAAAIGLALLTLASLALMFRVVQKRGRIGSKASVALRSLYTLVLGLGGLLFAALLVMTARLNVPLDSPLLEILAAGTAVALGVYLAWVHGEWSQSARLSGFLAAVAGAFLGALVGHTAIGGLPATVTTIVGAAAGANLSLLSLEIAWDVIERRRPAEVALPPQAPQPAG